jgi:hypothetical protein
MATAADARAVRAGSRDVVLTSSEDAVRGDTRPE